MWSSLTRSTSSSANRTTGAVGIPLLHIADTTASRVRANGRRAVGLLATVFTMEQDFYVGRMRDHGFEVVVPDGAERADVHASVPLYDTTAIHAENAVDWMLADG